MVSALFFHHKLVCIYIQVLGMLCADLLGGQELTCPRGGAQAVMSRRDAGLFLHAMYSFPLFCFPPFKKQMLSEPPVAHHFRCCVHPAPAPAKHCPCSSPGWPCCRGPGTLPTSETTLLPCRLQIQIHSPSYPQRREPVLCQGFSHPSCCRKPADQW